MLLSSREARQHSPYQVWGIVEKLAGFGNGGAKAWGLLFERGLLDGLGRQRRLVDGLVASIGSKRKLVLPCEEVRRARNLFQRSAAMGGQSRSDRE